MYNNILPAESRPFPRLRAAGALDLSALGVQSESLSDELEEDELGAYEPEEQHRFSRANRTRTSIFMNAVTHNSGNATAPDSRIPPASGSTQRRKSHNYSRRFTNFVLRGAPMFRAADVCNRPLFQKKIMIMSARDYSFTPVNKN